MIVLLLLSWLGLLPWPWAAGGFAVEPPVCTAAEAGSVACIAERLCRCGYERGGSTSEVRADYRWDCGVLRPYCHRPPAGPLARPPRDEVIENLRLIVPLRPARPAVNHR